MISPITTSKIYSTLGSNSSLVPLAIKDIANSLGLTAGAYLVGKSEEGQDRFIDEFGTQAIWLFGIPVYKKIIDLLTFKPFGFDSKVDVRTLKNKDIFEKAKKYAANDNVRKSLEKAANNQKTFKALTIGKFAASTLLTIATYAALTKFRHKRTEEKIRANILAEKANNQKTNENLQEKNNLTDKKMAEFSNNPSFKGGIADFMFNPVKNLMIVDAAISGERFLHSRSLQDFLGYTVKESTFWFFMYFASQRIQKCLENKALKNGRTIALDSRVIESPELKNAIDNSTIKSALKAFNKAKNDVEIYEFINKNPENFVVKMAKKSDIVKTHAKTDGLIMQTLRKIGILKPLKNADKIDTRAFIDTKEVKDFASTLEKLYNQYLTSGENSDKFLKSVKKLKRASVFKSMGACIGFLGCIAPTIMVSIRLLRHDKGFQVREKIEKEFNSNEK